MTNTTRQWAHNWSVVTSVTRPRTLKYLRATTKSISHIHFANHYLFLFRLLLFVSSALRIRAKCSIPHPIIEYMTAITLGCHVIYQLCAFSTSSTRKLLANTDGGRHAARCTNIAYAVRRTYSLFVAARRGKKKRKQNNIGTAHILHGKIYMRNADRIGQGEHGQMANII